ncbi:hypothetical protein LCGC14_0632200 [marine sediment metagenome]|uniref:Uncharacterized protein n=1 Tax=marine sediment metagenome TaxID=412755 RepID=A0A0F9R1K6_9ZZZZ
MSTKRKDYNCQFCQQPVTGYQAKYRHEKNCTLNPENIKPAEAIPEVKTGERREGEAGITETARSLQQEIDQILEDESGPVQEEPASEPASEPPPGPLPGPTPREMLEKEGPEGLENMIAVMVGRALIDFETRFEETRDSLGGHIQRVVDALDTQMGRLPAIIDSSVGNFMAAKFGQTPAPGGPEGSQPSVTPDGNGKKPEPEVLSPVSKEGARSNAGGQLMQMLAGAGGGEINPLQIFLEFLKVKGGGNINTAIAQFISGQIKPKKGASPDAKYLSRGMGHFMSAVRNKKVDSDSQALSYIAMADEMLKDKNLTGDMRGYFIGMKAGGTAYTAGRDLEAKMERQRSVEQSHELSQDKD